MTENCIICFSQPQNMRFLKQIYKKNCLLFNQIMHTVCNSTNFEL